MKDITSIADLKAAMQSCGDGVFSPIGGVTFGFMLENGKCVIFDAAESDGYREESFDSVDAALDGFMVEGKPLKSFVGKIQVTPCLTV